jgi:hypothetical protein
MASRDFGFSMNFGLLQWFDNTGLGTSLIAQDPVEADHP